MAFAPGAAGTGTAAWAAPLPSSGLDYVALGDSYAVGLALGTIEGDVPGCGQTDASYPRQLAAALELDLTDVTCSGATTANILTTPQVTADGTNQIQGNSLNAGTDVVTLTIGGNDLGFSSIIQSCLAASGSGPLLFANAIANCTSIYAPSGGVDTLSAAVNGPVTASLTATLAKINELAPNAQVFVVGYPALMPDAVNIPTLGCFTSFTGLSSAFPFTGVDTAYLHDIQAQLDTAMLTTATAAGASFVPLLASSVAHSPCANNQDAFVNGASLNPGAMHPNALGAAFMAAQATDAVQAAFTAPTIAPGSTSFGLPVDAAASLTFTTDGFPAPTLSLTGDIPEGMSFDSVTGVLRGTPITAGESTFSLTATNSVDETTEQYVVSVTQAPAITSTTPPAATVGSNYSFTVTATGYPTPTFAVSSGALPDGLTLDADSDNITGTPTAAGSFEFTITASNGSDPAATARYTVVSSKPAVIPPVEKPEVKPVVKPAVKPAAKPAPTAHTPNAATQSALATTGSDSMLSLGLVGGVIVLAGAGLLLAKRFTNR